MSLNDDYIIISQSLNTGDDSDRITGDEKIQGGSEDVFVDTFKNQGIFIEKEDEQVFSIKPRGDFSEELLKNGGIEIISGEEGDEEPYL